MRCGAVVVAAGSGQRFGGLKQFATLGGASIASRSIELCRSVADVVILVAPSDALDQTHGADEVVAGGETRSESVRRGLHALPDEVSVIVIHDAARPLASEELFFSVVAELNDEKVDAAIPGLEPSDTIKRVEVRDGRQWVVETIDRRALASIQTPQAFRASALRAAHHRGGEATDDAALIERAGGTVVVVAGEPDNVKITSPSDLDLAERIIGSR